MSEYIFNGPISENPLPEVLQKINYYKVPGVLTVSSDDVKKEIFISGGQIIFASSSLEDERLGEFLLHKGRITQEQYDESVRLMKETGRRQGAMLVESGALKPPELYDCVKQQVMAIVLSLFNWIEGDITFAVGKYKDDEIIKLNLDTRAAILMGTKSIVDPKRVVKWLGHKEDVFEPSEFALMLLPSLPLTLEDKQVFRLVDGKRSLIEILHNSPLVSGDSAKVLYALYILGLVRKRSSAVTIVVPTRGRGKSS